MARFATIGHSSRSLEAFVDILRAASVNPVADVRSFPRSRSNPTFNIDALPDRLAERQIGYRHMPGLGGRRGRQPGMPEEVNAGRRTRSFHNYADHALSSELAAALAELVELGRDRLVAIMCAERSGGAATARPTDFQGHEVVHLTGPGQATIAPPTPGARRTDDRLIVYPAFPE